MLHITIKMATKGHPFRRPVTAKGMFSKCLSAAKNVRTTREQTFCSSSEVPLPSIKITKNISLCETSKRTFEKQRRPLILLYGWLGAKAKHIDKYQGYYLEKGFDVAHIKVTYDEILQPKKAQTIADDVLNFVVDQNATSPVLPHCFSVGCYMYSEAVVKIFTQPERYGSIRSRICGQVYDSPVDLDVIPTGMANATTDNWLANKTIRSFVGTYLWLSSPWVTKHYLKASAAFKNNELRAPTLFLYSDADPVCFPDLVERIIEDYRKWGIPVWGKRWKESKHVSHYHHNPSEYMDLLDSLLDASKLSHKE